MAERWRQGRKVPHHVYVQTGPEPSDTDRWVGSFPRATDAVRAVDAVNAQGAGELAPQRPDRPQFKGGFCSNPRCPCARCDHRHDEHGHGRTSTPSPGCG